MRWCLYALGGGLGHLVRSLGLARAAVARGHHVTLLANSAYAPLLPVAEELEAVSILARSASEGLKSPMSSDPSLALRASMPAMKSPLNRAACSSKSLRHLIVVK